LTRPTRYRLPGRGLLSQLPGALATQADNLRYLPLRGPVARRILANYASILLLGRPRLRTVSLALDYRCQLSCSHCSALELREGQQRTGPRLPLGRFETLFDEIEACGAVNLHFTGGEPLISERLWQLLGMLRRGRFILSLVTNGLDLARHAPALARAGVNLVIVSIDSSNPDRHDAMRGYPGLCGQAWAGIDAAQAHGLQVMVAMVATPTNMRDGDILRMTERCRRRRIPVQILPARRVGMWADSADLIFSRHDRELFFRLTNSRWLRWDGQSSYRPPRCLAGRERLYISPEGEVFPCDFIHRSFGNVAEQPLDPIWRRVLATPPFHRDSHHCLTAFGDLS
jgi:MoaA/NifB/PqqE/SkfB family radical SAM enzyme